MSKHVRHQDTPPRTGQRRWIAAATVLLCAVTGTVGSAPAEALWAITDARITSTTSGQTLTALSAPASAGTTARTITAKTATAPSSDTLDPTYQWERSTTANFANPTLLDPTQSPTITDSGNFQPTESRHKLSKISAGTDSSCGLSGGDIFCWGDNARGQIGQGTTSGSFNTPTRVLRASDDTGSQIPQNAVFTDVAVGNSTACATTTSAIYCWGYNLRGAGSGANSAVMPFARQLAGTPAGAVISSISVGYDHGCAIFGTQDAYCWGSNITGQLGTGAANSSGVWPPQRVANSGVGDSVLPAGADMTKIQTGQQSTCLIAAKNVYCWGLNVSGNIGVGTIKSYYGAQRVNNTVLPSNTVTDISLTGERVNTTTGCAISGGNVYCWGAGANGALGNAATSDSPTPVRVTAIPSGTATTLSGGDTSNCAITSAATSWCWGTGTTGVLGNGLVNASTPIQSLFPDGRVPSQVSSRATHRCWIFTDGTAGCAGNDTAGRLGDGGATRPNAYTATTVAMPAALACASGSTLLDDGTCSLVAGTVYYYRVFYTIGSWVSPRSAVSAIRTAAG